ncbi:MAG: hypothetical protein P1U63_00540 [Coxiellaceae bacterium]|nr:hypothetical protein [Coxiellaceae bacterium]
MKKYTYIIALLALLGFSVTGLAQKNSYENPVLTIIYKHSGNYALMSSKCQNIELHETADNTRAKYSKLPFNYPSSATCQLTITGHTPPTPPHYLPLRKTVTIASFVLNKDGTINNVQQHIFPGQQVGIYTTLPSSTEKWLPITLQKLDIHDHMIDYRDSSAS